MEQLVQRMDEKKQEQKRAKTVRTDYKNDLDNLTDWVQRAEVKVRDKTSQPQILKQSLQEIQAEVPAMQERLEKLVMNAKVLCDNCQDPEEVSLIKGNVNTLSEQINLIKSWIDEKKQQIGDCLDSWERFLTLYNTVMNWAKEKQEFLKQPLVLDSLADAKTKLHDYNVNVKSCKNMGKTLSEMSKELEHISENGSIGDLSEKMEEAEAAKVEVEALLLERNALLHETSEEWEQCEKKLREVRSWLDKTKGALDSGAVKKKPLRDQLAAKEKTMADVSVQKTKISVSVEKLQVHFKCGLSGGDTVVETAEKLKRELDSLHGVVKQQSVELEAAIEQVEQYQQEILHLKQEVVTSEQKLRAISSPAYLPHDRDTALQEQNALKKSILYYYDKIREKLITIREYDPVLFKRMEPGFQVEPKLHTLALLDASYADITAGRASSPGRTPSPSLRNVPKTPSVAPLQDVSKEFKTASWSLIEAESRKEIKQPEPLEILEYEQSPPRRRVSRREAHQAQMVKTAAPSIVVGDRCHEDAAPQESPPCRKSEHQLLSSLKPDLLKVTEKRTRSKSPLWVPGITASFSDVVKGNSRSNSRAPSIEDLTSINKSTVEPDLHKTTRRSENDHYVDSKDVKSKSGDESHSILKEPAVIAESVQTVMSAPAPEISITEIVTIVQPPRSRSKSPLWIDGEAASTSVVHRRTSPFESPAASIEDLTKAVSETINENKTNLKPRGRRQDKSPKRNQRGLNSKERHESKVELQAPNEIRYQLSVNQPRARSKSPIWIPGQSASFSDVVKGASRCNSRVGSTEDLTSVGNLAFDSKNETETNLKPELKIDPEKGIGRGTPAQNVGTSLHTFDDSQKERRLPKPKNIDRLSSEEYRQYSDIIDKTYSFLEKELDASYVEGEPSISGKSPQDESSVEDQKETPLKPHDKPRTSDAMHHKSPTPKDKKSSSKSKSKKIPQDKIEHDAQEKPLSSPISKEISKSVEEDAGQGTPKHKKKTERKKQEKTPDLLLDTTDTSIHGGVQREDDKKQDTPSEKDSMGKMETRSVSETVCHQEETKDPKEHDIALTPPEQTLENRQSDPKEVSEADSRKQKTKRGKGASKKDRSPSERRDEDATNKAKVVETVQITSGPISSSGSYVHEETEKRPEELIEDQASSTRNKNKRKKKKTEKVEVTGNASETPLGDEVTQQPLSDESRNLQEEMVYKSVEFTPDTGKTKSDVNSTIIFGEHPQSQKNFVTPLTSEQSEISHISTPKTNFLDEFILSELAHSSALLSSNQDEGKEVKTREPEDSITYQEDAFSSDVVPTRSIAESAKDALIVREEPIEKATPSEGLEVNRTSPKLPIKENNTNEVIMVSTTIVDTNIGTVPQPSHTIKDFCRKPADDESSVSGFWSSSIHPVSPTEIDLSAVRESIVRSCSKEDLSPKKPAKKTKPKKKKNDSKVEDTSKELIKNVPSEDKTNETKLSTDDSEVFISEESPTMYDNEAPSDIALVAMPEERRDTDPDDTCVAPEQKYIEVSDTTSKVRVVTTTTTVITTTSKSSEQNICPLSLDSTVNDDMCPKEESKELTVTDVSFTTEIPPSREDVLVCTSSESQSPQANQSVPFEIGDYSDASLNAMKPELENKDASQNVDHDKTKKSVNRKNKKKKDKIGTDENISGEIEVVNQASCLLSPINDSFADVVKRSRTPSPTGFRQDHPVSAEAEPPCHESVGDLCSQDTTKADTHLLPKQELQETPEEKRSMNIQNVEEDKEKSAPIIVTEETLICSRDIPQTDSLEDPRGDLKFTTIDKDESKLDTGDTDSTKQKRKTKKKKKLQVNVDKEEPDCKSISDDKDNSFTLTHPTISLIKDSFAEVVRRSRDPSPINLEHSVDDVSRPDQVLLSASMNLQHEQPTSGDLRAKIDIQKQSEYKPILQTFNNERIAKISSEIKPEERQSKSFLSPIRDSYAEVVKRSRTPSPVSFRRTQETEVVKTLISVGKALGEDQKKTERVSPSSSERLLISESKEDSPAPVKHSSQQEEPISKKGKRKSRKDKDKRNDDDICRVKPEKGSAEDHSPLELKSDSVSVPDLDKDENLEPLLTSDGDDPAHNVPDRSVVRTVVLESETKLIARDHEDGNSSFGTGKVSPPSSTYSLNDFIDSERSHSSVLSPEIDGVPSLKPLSASKTEDSVVTVVKYVEEKYDIPSVSSAEPVTVTGDRLRKSKRGSGRDPSRETASSDREPKQHNFLSPIQDSYAEVVKRSRTPSPLGLRLPRESDVSDTLTSVAEKLGNEQRSGVSDKEDRQSTEKRPNLEERPTNIENPENVNTSKKNKRKNKKNKNKDDETDELSIESFVGGADAKRTNELKISGDQVVDQTNFAIEESPKVEPSPLLSNVDDTTPSKSLVDDFIRSEITYSSVPITPAQTGEVPERQDTDDVIITATTDECLSCPRPTHQVQCTFETDPAILTVSVENVSDAGKQPPSPSGFPITEVGGVEPSQVSERLVQKQPDDHVEKETLKKTKRRGKKDKEKLSDKVTTSSDVAIISKPTSETISKPTSEADIVIPEQIVEIVETTTFGPDDKIVSLHEQNLGFPKTGELQVELESVPKDLDLSKTDNKSLISITETVTELPNSVIDDFLVSEISYSSRLAETRVEKKDLANEEKHLTPDNKPFLAQIEEETLQLDQPAVMNEINVVEASPLIDDPCLSKAPESFAEFILSERSDKSPIRELPSAPLFIPAVGSDKQHETLDESKEGSSIIPYVTAVEKVEVEPLEKERIVTSVEIYSFTRQHLDEPIPSQAIDQKEELEPSTNDVVLIPKEVIAVELSRDTKSSPKIETEKENVAASQEVIVPQSLEEGSTKSTLETSLPEKEVEVAVITDSKDQATSEVSEVDPKKTGKGNDNIEGIEKSTDASTHQVSSPSIADLTSINQFILSELEHSSTLLPNPVAIAETSSHYDSGNREHTISDKSKNKKKNKSKKNKTDLEDDLTGLHFRPLVSASPIREILEQPHSESSIIDTNVAETGGEHSNSNKSPETLNENNNRELELTEVPAEDQGQSSTQPIQREGESETHVDFTIVQPMVRQIRKVRRVIRKVVIIDGKEHVTESVVDEPEQVTTIPALEHRGPSQEDLSGDYKSFSYGEVRTSRQVVVQSRKKITKTIKTVNGKVLVEEVESEPDNVEIVSVDEPSVSIIHYDQDSNDGSRVIVEHPPDELTVPTGTDTFKREGSFERIVEIQKPFGVESKTLISAETVADVKSVGETLTTSTDTKEVVTLGPELSDQAKTLDANKKSLSVGSDSSDNYYPDVNVKVTVPKEVSLTVDIKHPKDKKKTKKQKKQPEENTAAVEIPEPVLSVKENEKPVGIPSAESSHKSLTEQFIEAESVYPVSEQKPILEETESVLTPTVEQNLKLPAEADKLPEKKTKSKKVSKSIVSIETTVSPKEKGDRAVTLKVSKKVQKQKKGKETPEPSNISDELPSDEIPIRTQGPDEKVDETLVDDIVVGIEKPPASPNETEQVEKLKKEEPSVVAQEVDVMSTDKTVEEKKKPKGKKTKRKTLTGEEHVEIPSSSLTEKRAPPQDHKKELITIKNYPQVDTFSTDEPLDSAAIKVPEIALVEDEPPSDVIQTVMINTQVVEEFRTSEPPEVTFQKEKKKTQPETKQLQTVSPDEILSKLKIMPEELRKSLESLHAEDKEPEVVEVDLSSEEPERDLAVIDTTVDKYIKENVITVEEPQDYIVEVKTSVDVGDKKPISSTVTGPLGMSATLENEDGSLGITVTTMEETVKGTPPHLTDISKAFIEAEKSISSHSLIDVATSPIHETNVTTVSESRPLDKEPEENLSLKTGMDKGETGETTSPHLPSRKTATLEEKQGPDNEKVQKKKKITKKSNKEGLPPSSLDSTVVQRPDSVKTPVSRDSPAIVEGPVINKSESKNTVEEPEIKDDHKGNALPHSAQSTTKQSKPKKSKKGKSPPLSSSTESSTETKTYSIDEPLKDVATSPLPLLATDSSTESKADNDEHLKDVATSPLPSISTDSSTETKADSDEHLKDVVTSPSPLISTVSSTESKADNDEHLKDVATSPLPLISTDSSTETKADSDEHLKDVATSPLPLLATDSSTESKADSDEHLKDVATSPLPLISTDSSTETKADSDEQYKDIATSPLPSVSADFISEESKSYPLTYDGRSTEKHFGDVATSPIPETVYDSQKQKQEKRQDESDHLQLAPIGNGSVRVIDVATSSEILTCAFDKKPMKRPEDIEILRTETSTVVEEVPNVQDTATSPILEPAQPTPALPERPKGKKTKKSSKKSISITEVSNEPGKPPVQDMATSPIPESTNESIPELPRLKEESRMQEAVPKEVTSGTLEHYTSPSLEVSVNKVDSPISETTEIVINDSSLPDREEVSRVICSADTIAHPQTQTTVEETYVKTIDEHPRSSTITDLKTTNLDGKDVSQAFTINEQKSTLPSVTSAKKTVENEPSLVSSTEKEEPTSKAAKKEKRKKKDKKVAKEEENKKDEKSTEGKPGFVKSVKHFVSSRLFPGESSKGTEPGKLSGTKDLDPEPAIQSENQPMDTTSQSSKANWNLNAPEFIPQSPIQDVTTVSKSFDTDSENDPSYIVEVKTSISTADKQPIISVVEGPPGVTTSVKSKDGSVQISVKTEKERKSKKLRPASLKGSDSAFIEAETKYSSALNQPLQAATRSSEKQPEPGVVSREADGMDDFKQEKPKDTQVKPGFVPKDAEASSLQKPESQKPKKETSENLVQTIQERIDNINTPSFVGLLSDLDTTSKRKEISHNLDLLKNSSGEEKESIIVTTTILISEYLETITYIIINSKKFEKENTSPEDVMNDISHLMEDVKIIKDNVQTLKPNVDKKELIAALESQTRGVQQILDDTMDKVNSKAAERDEALNNCSFILSLINDLNNEISNLEKDNTQSAEKKLRRLDELDSLNSDYDSQVAVMLKRYPNQGELRKASHLLLENDEQLAGLRTSLLQSLTLAQEYRDTLVELENVSEVAKAIVASRVTVPSLKALQNEMQKERKFFVSLSHCRSILESLESALDDETRADTADLHKRLHSTASDVLESAGERAVGLALGASRWTLLEQGLAEERGWLRVAQDRVPNLHGVSSADYHQYLSLYQSLESDIEFHAARVWKILETAHTLQGLIQCNGLEESCEALHSSVAQLEEKVSEDIRKLISFRDQWILYEACLQKLQKWLDGVVPNYPHPLDIQSFWQLRAEYEVLKSVFQEACDRFSNALSLLPISDEARQKERLDDLKTKWAEVGMRLQEAEVAIPEDVTAGERLDLIEARLKQMETAMNTPLHMTTEAELDMYIGKLLVLKEGATDLENELLRFSLGPACERRRLGNLQGRARVLMAQVESEHGAAVSLKERLSSLRAGMSRAVRVHSQAVKILDQWEPTVDASEDVVQQALVHVKGVVKMLCDEKVELSWLRETLSRMPVSLRARLSLLGMEREVLSLGENQAVLGRRADELLALILSRLHLWEVYDDKLDSVRSTVREADYMMELLRVDLGPIDLPRIVKASSRLEGVKESLIEREGGLDELRAAGQALEAVVRPEVGERLRAEVREEEQAWARAEAGLGDLAGRYRRAADLWASYREAVQAAQPSVGLSAAPLSPQEWEKREEAVREAERLAEKIAAETGVPGILSAETQLLGRRLAEAKELSAPSHQISPPSSPLVLKEKILQSLQEKLNEYPKGEKSEQIIALRDSLLELGKTDAQIAFTSDGSSPDNVSVSDLLELWEKVFRETFQEYHRLSSNLARSEESSSIINLWRDYLEHVNQFLDSSLPHQYHELHETKHLCQVHQTVLSSQRSLLPREDTALDKDSIQQFSLLTNMHNETLAKIMEKQSEVQKRISLWDKYRDDQAELLDWLKRAENERNQLKLRYIHSKTIGRTIAKIEELIKRMSEGEEMELSLKDQLHNLILYCDESVASSLQIEHASLCHRLSNLHAALLTWKDYLLKVQRNIETYDSLVKKIQLSLDDVQAVLTKESKDFPSGKTQLGKKLQTITAVTSQMKDLSSDVEALEESKEILKDSLSPADLKSMTQRCWLFSQQHSEFEHQLLIAEQIIQEKLQLSTVYDQRSTRFLSWVTSIRSRLSYLPSDAASAQALVERELKGELSLKKSEVDWLTSMAKEVERDDVAIKVLSSWEDLQTAINSTADKLAKINKNIPKLEEDMDNLRMWLHSIESKLSTPIVLKQATKKYVNSQIKEHEALEKEIGKESSKIHDLLNFCETLLNDCESCNIVLDTETITLSMANLEKRWKEICSSSADRKSTLTNLWPIIEKAQNLAKEQKSWLSVLEKRIQELEKQLRLSSLENLPLIEAEISKLESDMTSGGTEGLGSLDKMYLSLHREYRLPEEMLKTPEELLQSWEGLKARAETLSAEARVRSSERERWLRTSSRAISAMAKIDAILTLAELQEPPHGKIQEIEEELERESASLQEADVNGLEIMKWCIKADIKKTQLTIDEYQNLWKNINDRLNKLKKKSIPIEAPAKKKTVQVEDQSVEVNTLRFETDRSVQVDTLGWTPPIARKEAFTQELLRTTQDLEVLLVRLADLSRLETQAEISKCIGECESNYELAKHLSETLIEQCSASREEALVEQIHDLGDKFDSLRNRALNKQNQLRETSARGRLTCPLCSNKNWQQLDNDLWRLEQWLQYAEGTLTSQPSNPPPSIEQLEDVIQDQRELLLDLDSHRSLVVSMNIVGTHLAEHSDDEERAKELRLRLTTANNQWERVCELATKWQSKLQTALLQNEEFHDTITELSEWLERTEGNIRQAEPIDLADPSHLIQAKYNKFKEMEEEVERCEARVRSLEEAARQVLSDDRTVERLGRLRLRLVSLSRLIGAYVHRLAAVLGHRQPARQGDLPHLSLLSQQLLENPTPGDEVPRDGDGVDTGTLVRCHRFLGRVMRASVPISAFLLLLLGAASFVPIVEQDFMCANSFLTNMAPMLRYPNGRPPI